MRAENQPVAGLSAYRVSWCVLAISQKPMVYKIALRACAGGGTVLNNGENETVSAHMHINRVNVPRIHHLAFFCFVKSPRETNE